MVFTDDYYFMVRSISPIVDDVITLDPSFGIALTFAWYGGENIQVHHCQQKLTIKRLDIKSRAVGEKLLLDLCSSKSSFYLMANEKLLIAHFKPFDTI